MKFFHSHSAHEAFDTCPARFALQQSGAPGRPEAKRYLFGRTFHRVAELYRNHCIENNRWSDVEVISRLVDQAFRETGLSLRHYEEIHAICRFFASYERIDIDRSLMREGGVALNDRLELIPWKESFDYDSPDFNTCELELLGQRCCGRRRDDPIHDITADGMNVHAFVGAALRLKFDEVMVDDSSYLLLIKDWKTDMHTPSATELEDRSRRWWKQAMWYSWAALRYLYPAAIAIQFDFVFVRWNITRTLTISRDDVAEFDSLLRARIQFIETTEKFLPRPSDDCRFCPFLQHGCPLAKKEQVGYETDVEEMAARFLYTAAVQEERRDILKKAANENGEIEIAGMPMLLFERSEKVVLDVKKLLDAMRLEEVENPELLLDASVWKLEKILGGEPERFKRIIEAATARSEGEVAFNVHQNKAELVALATKLGIEKAQFMKIAQLALAIAKNATPATSAVA